MIRHHYNLETVVATIDAVNGLRHEESLKQVAIADTLVVTKGDLAATRAWSTGPGASIRRRRSSSVPRRRGARRLFGRPARDPRDVAQSGHEHEDGIRAVCLFLDDELDWTAFGVWLTMLLQARGEDVLRVKGLLNVGAEGPLLVNGVQHAVHPPEHLDAWPDDDRRSRIVFIGRGFDRGSSARWPSSTGWRVIARKERRLLRLRCQAPVGGRYQHRFVADRERQVAGVVGAHVACHGECERLLAR